MVKSKWYENLKANLKNSLSLYSVLYKSNKILFFAIIVSFLLIILSSFTLPFLFKLILDNLTSCYIQQNLNVLMFVTIFFYVTFFLFDSFFKDIRIVIYKIWGKYIRRHMQTNLINKFKKLTFDTFEKKEFQDKIYTVIEGNEYVPISLVSSSADKLIASISLISEFIILATKNFILTIIIFIVFSTVIFAAIKIRNSYISMYNSQIICTRDLSYSFDIIACKDYKKELDIYNMYDFWTKRINNDFDATIGLWNSFLKKEINVKFLSNVCVTMFLFFAIMWFAIQTIYFNLSLSEFVFYFNLLFSIKISYELLTSTITKNYGYKLFLDNYLELLNLDEKIEGEKSVKEFNHTLEFKNVYFKYSENEEYTLENINFKVTNDERICIVGENGCGKTTLINLILKVHKPTSGEILLDGVNINEYKDENYFNLIGTITQDFNKYAMYVDEYISCGKNSNDIKRILEISDICKINKFISNDDIRTTKLLKIFDEKSLELSFGQWQKLAIARALYNDSPILILDEPTSALDPKSATYIYNYILSLKNKLIFFISHKPENFEKASKVLFLNNGRISGFGNHKDLLENNSLYKNYLN